MPVNNSQPQEVRARKYRRMSPSEGRKWVKKNIIPVTTFPEDEFIDRFGNYETSITGLSNNKTLYAVAHI